MKSFQPKNSVDWISILPKITDIQNIPYKAINSNIFYVFGPKMPQNIIFWIFYGLAPTLSVFPITF